MFERMRAAISELRLVASEMDRHDLSGRDAARVVELSTEAERIAGALRTLAVRRVEETKTWQKDGHRSAAQWVAAKTGIMLGQAIGVVETARRLEELPATREAFCSGRLSEAQAREITGATPDRQTERLLVETAQTETLKTLREECQ